MRPEPKLKFVTHVLGEPSAQIANVLYREFNHNDKKYFVQVVSNPKQHNTSTPFLHSDPLDDGFYLLRIRIESVSPTTFHSSDLFIFRLNQDKGTLIYDSLAFLTKMNEPSEEQTQEIVEAVSIHLPLIFAGIDVKPGTKLNNFILNVSNNRVVQNYQQYGAATNTLNLSISDMEIELDQIKLNHRQFMERQNSTPFTGSAVKCPKSVETFIIALNAIHEISKKLISFAMENARRNYRNPSEIAGTRSVIEKAKVLAEQVFMDAVASITEPNDEKTKAMCYLYHHIIQVAFALNDTRMMNQYFFEAKNKNCVDTMLITSVKKYCDIRSRKQLNDNEHSLIENMQSCVKKIMDEAYVVFGRNKSNSTLFFPSIPAYNGSQNVSSSVQENSDQVKTPHSL